jgi:hypothetical protein
VPAHPLRLGDDRRYLVDGDGAPFFYLADTAWAIASWGTPEEWRRYLDRRAAQGFNVVQVNLLPWWWRGEAAEAHPLGDRDAAGNYPFLEDDPARPNPAYFDRVEQFVAMAAERGLFVCLVLLWGGHGGERMLSSHLSCEQAATLARFSVEQFCAYPVLWSVAADGDYTADLDRWEAVGAAVEAADPHGHPTTVHLGTAMNWHFLFHHSPWHDFHMLQTGHYRNTFHDIAALPAAYRALEPAKPVINGEPCYEGAPANDPPGWGAPFGAADVRRAFWTSVLSGATMGHTYGAHPIWTWRRAGDAEPGLRILRYGSTTWTEALEFPGAAQTALGAERLRALPWWLLRPSPERVRLDPPSPQPIDRPVCAIAPGAAWVVYVPRAVGNVVLSGLESRDWRAHWLDPRTGEEQAIETPVRPDREAIWRAPGAPSEEDWVLVLSSSTE